MMNACTLSESLAWDVLCLLQMICPRKFVHVIVIQLQAIINFLWRMEKKSATLCSLSFTLLLIFFSKRSFLSLFILSAIPLFWGGFLLFLFLSLHLIYHNFILLSSDSPETIPILGRVDDLILVLLLLHTQSLLIIPLCLASSILSLLINHFGTQGDSDQPGLFCFSSGYRPSTMLWLCSVSLACCLAYVLVLMCYCFV